LAVTIVITAIFTLFSSSTSASDRSVTHRTLTTQHTAALPDISLSDFEAPAIVPIVLSPVEPPAPALVVTPVAPPAPAPVPQTDANSPYTQDWMCIRIHESGNRYNDPAAPSGAYGILLSTWRSFGYSGWPYQAPATVQDHLALELYNMYGFRPWSSRFACGL
jgi:hypothetical protein